MKKTLTIRYTFQQMAYWAAAAGILSFASAFLLGDCILETDNIVAIPLEENIISEIGIITKKGGRIYPGMKQMIDFFDARFGK